MSVKLTIEERELLKRIQRGAAERDVYIKATVLLMFDKGYTAEKIGEALGISVSTCYKYVVDYKAKGLKEYIISYHKGKDCYLTEAQSSILKLELDEKLYTNSKEIIAYIWVHFGVVYSTSGVIDLLHRLGYSYKQTTQVPCEADEEAQEKFIEETLPALLSEAEQGGAVVYYTDGVHPTHNTRSTYVWTKKGAPREQPSVSGRDRLNINGALNALDVTDIETIESGTVNAQSTIELYQKLLKKHTEVPQIYVISDNAKYYRNKELQEWLADNTRIKQVFLPPYSPNLNLIERVWKFMRKKVINTSFFRTKIEFKQALVNFFKHFHEYKQELVTLLTLNFRVCKSHF